MLFSWDWFSPFFFYRYLFGSLAQHLHFCCCSDLGDNLGPQHVLACPLTPRCFRKYWDSSVISTAWCYCSTASLISLAWPCSVFFFFWCMLLQLLSFTLVVNVGHQCIYVLDESLVSFWNSFCHVSSLTSSLFPASPFLFPLLCSSPVVLLFCPFHSFAPNAFPALFYPGFSGVPEDLLPDIDLKIMPGMGRYPPSPPFSFGCSHSY